MTPKQSHRFIVGMIPATTAGIVTAGMLLGITAGILLRIHHAPFWAGIIAVAVLCFTVLPWIMLADVWKLRNDRFRLDVHREVIIDGKPHIISGFTADGSMRDHTYITVTFEPTQGYINRNINHDLLQ